MPVAFTRERGKRRPAVRAQPERRIGVGAVPASGDEQREKFRAPGLFQLDAQRVRRLDLLELARPPAVACVCFVLCAMCLFALASERGYSSAWSWRLDGSWLPGAASDPQNALRIEPLQCVQYKLCGCHAMPAHQPPIDIARKPRETLSGDGLKGHHPSKFFAHFPS